MDIGGLRWMGSDRRGFSWVINAVLCFFALLHFILFYSS